jgi:uncharacterized protein YbjQ (UPF0145 family)
MGSGKARGDENMWKCSKCREEVEDSFEVCWNCGTANDGTVDPSFHREENDQAPPSEDEETAISAGPVKPAARTRKIIVTTGNEVAGQAIARYIGIVRGIVVRSPTIAQGLLGGLQQIVGGNIEPYAEVCEEAREEAYQRMVRHALEKGADAIVGMRYDATEFAQGVTEVLAYGTAVKLSRA